MLTYDDFVVGADGAMITGAWGNFLTNSPSQRAYFEIRRDMDLFGGTLIRSGEFDAVRLPTGRAGFGYQEYHLRGSLAPFWLEPGRYWLTVGVALDTGSAFLTTTSGTDEGPSYDPNPPPVGEPRGNNDNSFIYTWNQGMFYNTSIFLGSGTWDFSLGVEIVPEVSGRTMLLCSSAALLVRGRRSTRLRRGPGSPVRQLVIVAVGAAGSMPLSAQEQCTVDPNRG